LYFILHFICIIKVRFQCLSFQAINEAGVSLVPGLAVPRQFRSFSVMHRRICVHTNIATTKNHSNWLLNGHDERCTEENDAILSWNSGICLLFMKCFFCTAVQFLGEKKIETDWGFTSIHLSRHWSWPFDVLS
jgi:hypothetical protein